MISYGGSNVSFQSTLLMRGATLQLLDAQAAPLAISIHAPHARSDAGPEAVIPLKNISIHAPHARSDGVSSPS